MSLDDIITVPITQEMIMEAEEEASFLKSKYGSNTRPVISERDIIGSLAHQAVEVFLDSQELAYKSYRKIKYQHGDNLDIEYENDKIDVKGTHGELDQWFYNKNFLVFQDQLDDPKINKLTHFVFVLVKPDFSEAYIFGIISIGDFLSKSKEVILKYKNQEIRAYQLRPFRKYIWRT